jgi:uncharacterized membrane protein YoaK (UPF0700 family)
MPVNYLAGLTATVRSRRANLHLGVALAFVAGALNAGGFLAIGQYKSLDWSPISANRVKPRVLGALIMAFALGGIIGAIGFKYVGYVSTVPLAVALIVMSAASFFRKVQ